MTIRSLASFGYMARATIYLLMGSFSLLVAIGSPHGSTTDPKGAVAKLFEQPLGQWFLFVLAMGLFCYSLWRFIQSFLNKLPGSPRGIKAMGLRIGYAIGGISHGLLGIYSLKLLFFHRAQAGASEKDVAHWLLVLPFGQVITSLIAMVIMGFGVSQFYQAWTNHFAKNLSLPENGKSWICRICKVGFAARGLVFVMIGIFFFQAAWHFNSREAGGISMAWKVLRELPYGDFLIFFVGIGFIAFAFYGFAEAKYQKT
ncbi:MAG: DUF1206 domain-containing protein [Pseudobdellovibrionaceae bacterium]